MTGADQAKVELADLVAPEHVVIGLAAADKAQVVKELARIAAAATGIEQPAIIAAVTAREALGSTGVGGGIAIPHAQLPGLDRFWGGFARLARKVEFDSIDGVPVDLVFLLLIPGSASEHVRALSSIARRLRDPALVLQIRGERCRPDLAPAHRPDDAGSERAQRVVDEAVDLDPVAQRPRAVLERALGRDADLVDAGGARRRLHPVDETRQLGLELVERDEEIGPRARSGGSRCPPRDRAPSRRARRAPAS